MFEKIYTFTNGVQHKLSAQDLKIMVNNDQVSDLNLIYRANTKKAFVAFRLSSWVDRDKAGKGVHERVVKFLVEVGAYDPSKPKGQRQKEYIQIFMDEDEFSYFCGLLKGGRILDVMERKERSGDKVPYLLHNGKGDAKRLRIYRGSKMPVILEAAQGPGKTGDNGQTLPDAWEGANKDKVRKAMIGLSEQEVGKIGAAGERALSILDMWRAFGRDEENLSLINIRKEGRKNVNADRYEERGSYREQSRGYDGQGYGSYAADGSRARGGANNTGYYDNGYASGEGW